MIHPIYVQAICIRPFEEARTLRKGDMYLIEVPRDGQVITTVKNMNGVLICYAYLNRFEVVN